MSNSASAYEDDLHEYMSLCEYFGLKPTIDEYSFDGTHAIELKRRYNTEGSPKPERPSAFERLAKDEDDF